MPKAVFVLKPAVAHWYEITHLAADRPRCGSVRNYPGGQAIRLLAGKPYCPRIFSTIGTGTCNVLFDMMNKLVEFIIVQDNAEWIGLYASVKSCANCSKCS